mgnify:FL=1
METNNIYQLFTSDSVDKKSCIEVQLGKQKKKRFKDTSIFFSPEGFGPLEQTIWDNFREYSSNSTVKISSKEWAKIVVGLQELSVLLKDKTYNKELLSILGFKSLDMKQMYEVNFTTINLSVDKMLQSFIAWIEPNLKDNDFITING